MANRRFTQFYSTLHNKPVQLDCGFYVDADDSAGKGQTDLVGPGIQEIFMNTTATPAFGSPNPAPGYILVKLQDNYRWLYAMDWDFWSPNSGTPIAASATTLATDQVYVITLVGTTTPAQWQSIGLAVGITPAIGVSFYGTGVLSGAIGTGTVEIPLASGSGVATVEVVGDPNKTITSLAATVLGVSSGAYLNLVCLGTTAIASGGGGGPMPVPGAPDMGSLDDFLILAGSTTTNTGTSVVNGDLGLSPGTSVTGYPPGIVTGAYHVTDAAAAQAQVDLTAAYLDLQGRTGAIDESGIDLGTLTLGPGVYEFTTSAQLTGDLILDAGGDPAALWIFQIGSTLTTASSSSVVLINGAVANNVYWQVGTSATLGTSSSFKGTIMADQSITATTSAIIDGRLLARSGAVTLDTNAMSQPEIAMSEGSEVEVELVTAPTAPADGSYMQIKLLLSNTMITNKGD